MNNEWSNDLHVKQVRFARPTDKINDIEKFYCEGLGLKKIGSFYGHEGYDGIMIGLPDSSYHLEFTQHVNGSPCPAPTKDNLLVLYIPDKIYIDKIANRLFTLGYLSVSPENNYWLESGITIVDPDGWRIVLMNTSGI